jgi:hypothetical protein
MINLCSDVIDKIVNGHNFLLNRIKYEHGRHGRPIMGPI